MGTVMADRPAPEITVSVVSHGHGAMVSELLGDLAALPEVARCVVTLNIPEPDIAIPPALASRVVWRRNAHRLGFGANHNGAFTDCDTPYYCIINPDVRITGNPFPALLSTLQQDRAALAAPAILSPEGRLEDSVRHFPTPVSLAAKALFGIDGRYGFTTGDPHFTVDWVGGMCMLFRRDAFTAVKGFDESFFLYYEDVDLCARLGQQGWHVFAVPQASVVHNARRDSHRKLRYLRWHLASLLRYLARRALGRYRPALMT